VERPTQWERREDKGGRRARGWCPEILSTLQLKFLVAPLGMGRVAKMLYPQDSTLRHRVTAGYNKGGDATHQPPAPW